MRDLRDRRGIGGFMRSPGKKFCLVYMALGSTAAIATLNTI
jgi:hypothetical protein